MRASFQWISSLVPGLQTTPEELAARLTGAGLEVEATIAYGAGIEPCVVARVVSTRPHPSRSSLNLVTVDRGGGTQEVVCGAPNVPAPGGLVVLAPLGTYLPAKKMTIEPRAIGGITSEGMLCSEAELGLSEDSAGILVLPEGTAAPGTKLGLAVPATRDTLFEIGLTPNRPDGLGHLGLAREVAALYGIPWKVPTEKPLPSEGTDIASLVRVTIEDGERCPHYGAAAVLGASIGPSPLAVRYRLSALGVRPISSAVDVTNLVMLEYGHPMHAFDLDKVRGAAIVVRRAREGEKLTTLDGIDRTLTADDLVICDGEGPVALAGVMGGGNSEISATTKRILLECAFFDARGVRRTARRHGIHTESSHRFERGVDHGDTARALARAAELTRELAGGTVAKGALVVVAQPIPQVKTSLRVARMNQLLGVSVSADEATGVLTRLGFDVTGTGSGDGAVLEAAVPTHRPDITREVDLIEEVARVRGMEAIPTRLPALRPPREPSAREELLRRARRAAVELGLSEALLYGFVSRRALEQIGAPEPTVVLKNPLTENQAVMRTSLLPGLLDAAERAARHGERDVRLFGVGPLFLPRRPGTASLGSAVHDADAKLPEERLAFAAILTGERATHLGKPEPVDVWDAKGLALGFLERVVGAGATVLRMDDPSRAPHLHPRGAGVVSIGGREVGRMGPLHPDVATRLELTSGAVVVEIDLAAVGEIGRTPKAFRAIPRFPAATRDLAVVVGEAVLAGDVERAVRDTAGDLAEHVEIFDRFVGGSIPAGHASLAFHVVYRAGDRTLTDVEVDTRHAKVVAEIQSRFGAMLR